MCVPSDGQHVGAGVHHDEEEDPGEVESLQVRVVLHHHVQQIGHFLHQDGVKGQEQLPMTGEEGYRRAAVGLSHKHYNFDYS